jgi:hypothetical protein
MIDTGHVIRTTAGTASSSFRLERKATMTLHPQAQALLDAFSDQSLPPFEQMSPTQARLVALGFRDLQGEPEPVGEVRDVLVPGPAGMLPVRVYHPAPARFGRWWSTFMAADGYSAIWK